MKVTTYRAAPVLLFAFVAIPLIAQQANKKDPLASYLNPPGLSPVPAHSSYYKPGAIVIVEDNNVRYRDPFDDVLLLKPDAAQKSLPEINFSDKKAIGAATAVLGFKPAGVFNRTTTLTSSGMQMSGWRLTSNQHDAILMPKTATFDYVDKYWERTKMVGGGRRFYLVTEVYLSSHADVVSTTSTGVTLTTSTSQNCGKTDKTATGADKQAVVETIADLAAGNYQSAVKFCDDGNHHVSFTYDNPVPVAMVVEELELLSLDQPLRPTGATVKW